MYLNLLTDILIQAVENEGGDDVANTEAAAAPESSPEAAPADPKWKQPAKQKSKKAKKID